MSDLKLETARKLDMSCPKSKGTYRTPTKSFGGVPQQSVARVQSRRYRSYSATMNRPQVVDGDKSPTENPMQTRKFSQPSLNNFPCTGGDRVKRRHGSLSTGCVGGFKRRKKESCIVPPTKFLLGGNITDPLNLNSFVDEKPGSRQQTPNASPHLPVPKQRSQVEVLIPANINDPLNLNGCNEDTELESIIVMPVKSKKRKRKKGKIKKRSLKGLAFDDHDDAVEKMKVSSLDVSTEMKPHDRLEQVHLQADYKVNVDIDVKAIVKTELQHQQPVPPRHKKNDNKIVSPAVAQPTRKRRPSGHSRQANVRESNISAGQSNRVQRDRQKHRTSGADTEDQPDPETVTFNSKAAKFRYGNYNRYYGYRNPDGVDDYRLKCFSREWFAGMDVLDVGCNIGHVTLSIARDFAPRKIVGVDIDASLVRIARRNVVHYLPSSSTPGCDTRFPISLSICCGPIAMAAVPAHSSHDHNPVFPNNVCFVEGNYVLESDELLEVQRPDFDTIICLSLTKWVHLNWGDAGLQRLFKRIFRQLRPGGRLILEAQAFTSYGKKKKLAPEILENYRKMTFMPEQFTEYLLSKEVGFSKCEVIDTPFNVSKGFRRPLQLFTKGGNTPTHSSPPSSLSSTRKED